MFEVVVFFVFFSPLGARCTLSPLHVEPVGENFLARRAPSLTTHQKGRKMIERVERKRTKARERERESKLFICEKSALSAGNFFHFDDLVFVAPRDFCIFIMVSKPVFTVGIVYIVVNNSPLLLFYGKELLFVRRMKKTIDDQRTAF